MNPITHLIIENTTTVVNTLTKMNSMQRIAWLFNAFTNTDYASLNNSQLATMKTVFSPYMEELKTYLNAEYERVSASVSDHHQASIMATKHYIMMKKLEVYC